MCETVNSASASSSSAPFPRSLLSLASVPPSPLHYTAATPHPLEGSAIAAAIPTFPPKITPSFLTPGGFTSRKNRGKGPPLDKRGKSDGMVGWSGRVLQGIGSHLITRSRRETCVIVQKIRLKKSKSQWEYFFWRRRRMTEQSMFPLIDSRLSLLIALE